MLKSLLSTVAFMKRKYRSKSGSDIENAFSRKNMLLFNASSGVSSNLITGNFFTGFLLLLNADDGFMGLVAMAGSFANLLQVLSPILLERFPRRKGLLIYSRLVFYFFNIIVIGIVPFLPGANGIKLMIILSIQLVVNLFNAILAPGYSVWHIKNVPERLRTDYFTRITIMNGVLAFTSVLVASKAVDYFKGKGSELQGLLLLRGVALILCFFDIYFLFRIKEHPNPPSDKKITFMNVLLNPFKEKKYLVSVFAACLWLYCSGIPGPYYGMYLLKDLQVSYSFINIVGLANIPALIFLTPLWRKIIHSTSWFKTLCIAIALYSLSYLGLALTTRETLYLYTVSSIFNIMVSPGITLSIANMPYINIPEKNQTNYIGFFSTMTSLASLLGVLTGKQFIKYTGGIYISLLGVNMQNKQYFLLVSAAAMLISSALIYIMQKKLEQHPQEPIQSSIDI